MIFERKIYLDKIYKYLKKEKLLLLIWARQVWKTTILEILEKTLKWKKYFYSFEDDFSKIEFENKNDFISYFELSLWVDFYKKWYFFIDEYQYVKNWEQILKSLYDDNKIKLKFVVTGSWLWNYNKENKWNLVWRWKEIFIYPFSFLEFLEFKWVKTKSLKLSKLNSKSIEYLKNFFEEFISFWWYPAVVKKKTKDEKIEELEKIITRYLERDISFFLRDKDFLEFKKFFIYLYSQVWNLVKKEAISNFLWIWVKKIEKYIILLEKTLFIRRVYPFFKQKEKEYSSLPKFYFWDVWIINFLEKSFDFRENEWKIVENFIFNEIEKTKKFNSDEIKTYKKITKSEIDFIYNSPSLFIAIEVKSWNRKAIPKIFYEFEKKYSKKTSFYIVTSSNYFKKDKLWDKKLYFIPNFLVSYLLAREQKVDF